MEFVVWSLFLAEGTQIAELRPSRALAAECCSDLRTQTKRVSKCAGDPLSRTLQDQAGLLIHFDNEGKSIREGLIDG